MAFPKRLLIVILVLTAANAQGASSERNPHIGYLYPAGGQQGSAIKITVGGQFLRDVDRVYVSGKGVTGSVVKNVGRVKPLNPDQRKELQNRLSELRKKQQGPGRRDANRPADINTVSDSNKPPVTLPDHPLLRNLDKLSPKGMQKVREEFLTGKFPASMAISETVIIEITIDANAEPGDRQLRLGTRTGLTNPLCFQVGDLPEISEPEYKDPGKPVTPRGRVPAVLNGQILPGERDRFRFSAKKGQNLTIEAQARHLIPYLADAVPGWFQITLALYDDTGKELAFADDYRFNPDPVLFYKITEDGDYELEIRDSIYRGREDFVYRISLSERPFITQIFPLGGRRGFPTVASLKGWNLDANELLLDTGPDGDSIRETRLRQSNSVSYAVDNLPECEESNDTIITLPVIINGRTASPGQVDKFRFDGNEGDEVVAEVYARRLNSPLDSLLWLTDSNGQKLARNDDNNDKNVGLLTHNADSYLRFRLPESGTYFVYLADSQSHGGQDFGYRLRISPLQPDFVLLASPSSLNIPPGSTVAVTVEAIRKDGFKGEIELSLKDAPAGFKLGGAKILAGCDRLRFTITSPQKSSQHPVNLQLEGSSDIEGRKVSRMVIPADDMMQAFIYRHLVASQQFLVSVPDIRRRTPAFEIMGDNPVRIPAGGVTKVRVKCPKKTPLTDIKLELSEPPAGLSLEDVNIMPGEITLLLKADADKTKAGTKDNLIVEVSTDITRNPRGGQKKQQKQRVNLGVLPAISLEITRAEREE